jgi:hypothetical protein
MRRRIRRRNGVFCSEGEWYANLRKPTSIEGALSLLKTERVSDIPYIHRNVATREELHHYISKWTQKQFNEYPLLYLGLHGGSGKVYIGDRRSSSAEIEIKELKELISPEKLGMRKRIVHFGSCSTLELHGNVLRGFLNGTGLFAVFGHEKGINWMESAIFEVALLYNILHAGSFTKVRIDRAIKDTKKQTGVLHERLGFRSIVRNK